MRFSKILISLSLVAVFSFNTIAYACGKNIPIPTTASCHHTLIWSVPVQDCCNGHFTDNLLTKNTVWEQTDFFQLLTASQIIINHPLDCHSRLLRPVTVVRPPGDSQKLTGSTVLRE